MQKWFYNNLHYALSDLGRIRALGTDQAVRTFKLTLYEEGNVKLRCDRTFLHIRRVYLRSSERYKLFDCSFSFPDLF